MSTGYDYKGTARWAGDRRGLVSAEEIEPPIDFSAPPEFQGQPGLWTPEHFLVSAVAACFVTTFLAIAELSKFEPRSLEVTAEGTVEKADGHFRFTHVIIRPVLAIDHESDRERAQRLLEKAEHSCLVSRSLQSKVVLEPTITVLVRPLKSADPSDSRLRRFPQPWDARCIPSRMPSPRSAAVCTATPCLPRTA